MTWGQEASSPIGIHSGSGSERRETRERGESTTKQETQVSQDQSYYDIKEKKHWNCPLMCVCVSVLVHASPVGPAASNSLHCLLPTGEKKSHTHNELSSPGGLGSCSQRPNNHKQAENVKMRKQQIHQSVKEFHITHFHAQFCCQWTK